MKSAPFTLSAPVNLEEAIASFREGGMYSKFIAGSQSLGPMLNLRLSQPDNLISLRNLSELREVADLVDSIFIGAGITHAEIEDVRADLDWEPRISPQTGILMTIKKYIK